MRKILIAMAIIGSTIIASGCCKKAVEPCNECACQAVGCGGDCEGNWIEIPGWECR